MTIWYGIYNFPSPIAKSDFSCPGRCWSLKQLPVSSSGHKQMMMSIDALNGHASHPENFQLVLLGEIFLHHCEDCSSARLLDQHNGCQVAVHDHVILVCVSASARNSLEATVSKV